MILEEPKFLTSPQEDTYIEIKDANDEEMDETEHLQELSGHNIIPISIDRPIVDPASFTNWRKLLRITAYVFRFITSCKTKNLSCRPSSKVIDNPSLSEAKKYWIKWAQLDLSNIESKTNKLNTFCDNDEIIRLTGRLRSSTIFTFDQKHPILLSPHNPISKLILVNLHSRLLHPGHARVLAESRKEFWIINGRSLAKSIGHKCVTCRRWRGKALSQIMSDLPHFRITPKGAPFENTTVDYFGPFSVKHGYRARIKAYGVIFACLVTKVVHLDIVMSLTTPAFLMALRRFIALYGQPAYIRSDNGSNFKGAAAELKKMLKEWSLPNEEGNSLKNFAASINLHWTFSTPNAPHHNGAVEILVKSVKSSLNKVVKDHILSAEEYRTILSEIESSINSRPLWPSDEGSLEDPPITCHDLLRPRGLLHENEMLNCMSPKTRYGHVQKIVDEWWKIWMRNFVPNLQIRSKWYKLRTNISIGDIVLCIDPLSKRSNWQMGIITNTFPGIDKNVRSVEVKTKTGHYFRPIAKLCLFLSKEELNSNI